MACPIQDCENQVKPFGYLCADHACCIPDCIFERRFINCKEYKYCAIHTCEFSMNYQCMNLRMPEYKYCDRHKCGRSNCTESAEYGPSCYTHKCRADVGCYNATEYGEKWCKKHTCQVCFVNQAMNKKTFCEKHGCHYYDCEEQILSQYSYCNKHKCKYNDCPRCSHTRSYCEIHKCIYTYCREKKENGLDCCAKHVCLLCTNACTPSSLYCTTHKCKKDSCEKASIESKESCDEHKCKFNGCTNAQLPKHYFDACDEHICYRRLKFGCCAIKMPNSPVCKSHKCLISSCQNERTQNYHEEYKYCQYHRCDTHLCHRMKQPQFLSCYCHLPGNSKTYIQYTLSDYGKIIIKDINNIIKQYIVSRVELR